MIAGRKGDRVPFHIKDHDPLIHKLFMTTLMVMIIAELSTSVATMLDGIIIARFFSTYAVAAYGLYAGGLLTIRG